MVSFVLPKIYASLRVKEWRFSVLEKEVKNAENISLIWSYIVLKGFYSDLFGLITTFLSEVSLRRAHFVEVSKFFMLSDLVESSSQPDLSAVLYKQKLSELSARQKVLGLKH
jgi:hypothetical protein